MHAGQWFGILGMLCIQHMLMSHLLKPLADCIKGCVERAGVNGEGKACSLRPLPPTVLANMFVSTPTCIHAPCLPMLPRCCRSWLPSRQRFTQSAPGPPTLQARCSAWRSSTAKSCSAWRSSWRLHTAAWSALSRCQRWGCLGIHLTSAAHSVCDGGHGCQPLVSAY